MNTKWEIHGRTWSERVARAFRQTTAVLPLRHRLDLVLVAGLAGALALLTTAWLILVTGADRLGLFDAPLVRPLEDERILVNVRDNLEEQPLLDAAFHPPDGRIYLSQRGGTIHRYDPATHLWASDRPLAGNDAIRSDLVRLRSGCGTDHLSEKAGACPDPHSLWAQSEAGGLARRANGAWEVVVGESAFIGARGIPVENEELTAAAVSADNAWLVVGTRRDGIGVYDIRHRSWIQSAQAFSDRLPSPEIGQVVWWRGRFWIGTPAGLAVLVVGRGTPELTTLPELDGEILDLDPDPEGALWILRRIGCENGGGCLWFGRLDRPGGSPVPLLHERELFPTLSLAGLSFAQQWGDLLAVAGEAGAYLYDVTSHSWTRRFDRSVATTLPMQSGQGFYFGYAGGVGALTPEETRLWEISRERVVALHAGAGDELLALAESGNAYTVITDTAQPIFTGTSTALDPSRFTSAVSFGQHVLFVGPDGALLHDVAERRYEDIPAGRLPGWLTDPGSRLVGVGNAVYAVAPASGSRVAVYTLAGADLARTSYYGREIEAVEPVTLPAPVAGLWPWGDAGLGLLAGDGRVYRVNGQGLEALTGPAEPRMDGATILDLAELGGELVVATADGLRRYDERSREWSALSDSPAAGRIVELTTFQDTLLARDERNRLVQQGEHSSVLIGGSREFNLDDAALSDARQDGGALYLAGSGWVERYDPATRSITDQWELPEPGRPTLTGVIDEEPLTLVGEAAVLGAGRIDAAAGPVEALSLDVGFIWTVRRGENGRYLKGYLRDNPRPSAARCFFRNPVAGGGATRIVDASSLPQGRVAVATDAGLRFYDPAARSWLGGPAGPIPGGGRLYRLDDHLLTVERTEGRFELSFIPLDSIEFPDSCSTAAASAEVTTISAMAVAIDEGAGRAAWLAADGSVTEWRAGRQVAILPAATDGPPPDQLRRVYERNGSLLFATDREIWRYDLTTREWLPIQVTLEPEAEPASLDIESLSGREIVVARTAGGDFYVGQFEEGDRSVALRRVFTASTEGLDAPAEALLDVQAREGLWTFVLHDRIKYFDPIGRAWQAEVGFPVPDPSLSYLEGAGRAVAVADQGRVWWVGQTAGATPERFARHVLVAGEQTALDGDGAIWRLTGEGELFHCPAPGEGDYTCSPHGPPPFTLDPATVSKAFRWESLVLFDTSGGLRIVDAGGREIALPAEAAAFGGVVAAREAGEVLFLWNGDSLLRLRLPSSDQVEVAILPAVREFVYDDQARPWARFDDGWRLWNGSEFQPAPAEGIRLFVTEGAQAAGLDAAGIPYRWADGTMVPSQWPLPAQIAPDAVTSLIPAPDDGWWGLSGRRLDHVRPGSCPQPGAVEAGEGALPDPQGTVTPTVEMLPCLVVAGSVPLPSAFASGVPSFARLLDGAVELTSASGLTAQVRPDASGQYQIIVSAIRLSVPGALPDEWATLRAFVTQLPNGAWAYDPVTALDVSADRELVAVRPSGTSWLADRGATHFDLPAALDAGWLRWDRAGRTFFVAGSSGTLSIPADQFIVDNRLLFETADALLAEAPDRLYLANRHGVWFHSRDDLRLDDPGIRFSPIALNGPIEAAHGRFLTPSGDLPVGEMRLVPPEQTLEIQTGDVRIVERLRDRRVSASLTVGGSSLDAFAERGFRWDRNRRGLGYDGGRLLLQTDAGIHPTDRLAEFDLGPDPTALQSGRLHSEGGQGLFLQLDRQWYRRDPAGWSANVPDPTADRLLLQEPRWTWRLQGGQTVVALAGEVHGFALFQGSDGVAFTADRLRAASAHAGALYVATEAFFEIAADPDELGTLTASRLPPVVVDRLEELLVAGGGTMLLRTARDSVSAWDAGARRFVALDSAADPYRERRLIETDRLRFTAYPDRVVKELSVETVGGDSHWVPFDFVESRFPFDVVTSLAALGDALYVGSAAGLQLYSSAARVGLGDLDALYSLGDPAEAALVAAERVGLPQDVPDLVMARSARACIERRPGGSFTPCRDRTLLDWRLRLANPLWRWSQAPDGHITGRYRDYQGTLIGDEIELSGGRFPHDRLRGASVCGNQAYTLWETGWVTVYPDATLRLDAPVLTFAFDRADGARLICLERDLVLPGATMPRGAYFELSPDQLFHYHGGEWRAVLDAAQRGALVDWANRPPVLDRDRLRLVAAPAGGYQFEQRTLEGFWHSLPWEEGRVAIDHWREFLWLDGRLWVATPAGLVAFDRAADGRAVLDADTLGIVREPAGDGDPCPITDLAPAGPAVLARCGADSAQVYEGTLDGRETNVFQPHPGPDPFAERLLVGQAETGYWEWRLTGRAGGSPGHLAATLHGEEIRIVGGRFEFDTLNSLALFEAGRVELGTDAGGWFQLPRESRHLRDWRRPVGGSLDPRTVSAVGLTRAGEAALLCLRLSSGSYLRLATDAAPSETERCPEHQGDDGFWSYARHGGQLTMTAVKSEGGAAQRRLVAGRFADDITAGLPVAGEDGDGLFYLIPTAAGVLRLDETLASRAISLAPFPGFPADAAPTVLFMLDGTTPAYLGEEGLYTLQGRRDPIPAIAPDVPDGAAIRRIDYGPQDWLRVGWEHEGRRGWTLVRPGSEATLRDAIQIDVSRFGSYRVNRLEWGHPTPWLDLFVTPGGVEVAWSGGGGSAAVPFPSPLELLAAIPSGERLILVGSRELLDVNLDAAMVKARLSDASP